MGTHLAIESVQVRDFRCLRDVTVDLGPLTVLIGKNDTGKSSFLEALFLACGGEMPSELMRGQRLQDWVRHGATHAIVGVRFDGAGGFESSLSNPAGRRQAAETTLIDGGPARDATTVNLVPPPYMFDLDALRHYAIVGSQPGPLPYNGKDLPAVLDRFLQPHSRWARLQDEFLRRFPSVKALWLRDVPDGPGHKYVAVTLRDGAEMPIRALSDGAVIVLAVLAIVLDDNASPLVMIEEPENGMHPGQLKGVVDLLTEVTASDPPVQVVLTTHSPYLLDFVDNDAIRVFTRDSDGEVSVTRFDESPDVKRLLAEGYSPGEAWLNTDEGKAPTSVVTERADVPSAG